MNKQKINPLLNISSAATPAEKNIRLDVQGLRAVAVLAVIIYHVNNAWLPSGFVGVDVFFVISGFIITSIIVGNKEDFAWKEFYWGRIKRIAPAYLLLLTVVTMVSAALFLPADFDIFKDSLKAALSFTSNSYFEEFGNYFAPSSHELPLLHTWSLAIEVQFYIFLPVLVVFVPPKFLKTSLIIIIISFLMWSEYRIFNRGARGEYFSLLARIPEFMIGALVALLAAKSYLPIRYASMMGWAGALLLIIGFVFVDAQRFPGIWALLPCIGTALLIAAQYGTANLLLSTRPMVWVGGISYSLYLWHWPILTFIRYYTGQYELQVVWLVVFVISTFVISWICYRLVESPARHARKFSPMLPATLVICSFVVFFGSKQINISIMDELPVEMTRYAPSNGICHGVILDECIRGDRDVSPSALVIGDSHAAQLNLFFDEVGLKNKTAYRVITASNCVPIADFDVERLPSYSQDSCRSQIKAADKFISEADVIIVAGMWQYQSQSPEFVKVFSAFLDGAVSQGKKVIVMAQIPMFDVNLLRVRRFSALGLPVHVNKNREWKSANSKIRVIIQAKPGVQFLDFSGSDFFANAPIENGVLIYHDNHHLNELGARRYGNYAANYFVE